MNKKAQFNPIVETARGFQVMFAFILVVIIISLILLSFYDNTATKPEFQTSALSNTMTKMQEYPIYVDWGTLVLFGIIWISSVWLLSRVEAEPILLIISWVGMIGLSVAIIGAGYALDAFVNSPLVADAVANMIFIPFYASNAFLFAVLFFCSCLVALHAPKQ